ncbi:hypothetical protein DFR86_09475 [Acidianus sulfidivorans JP7]|uniref:Uncharacterized protein n=1 Tax=Acidianus sulfidivorans JP7 TaxID=619593 RepID=A0A2U9IP13_9CREN|nr:hypothetical protein [Acidianus sulfidivorans]AWR97752.1 hypothetical protein DFR86_09475 [Acidianus sulfidivorans JP7]
MKVKIEYYKPEPINIGGISLISIKKEKEEDKDYDKSLEDLKIDNYVIVINTKDGKIVNSDIDCTYQFSFPVKVYKIGLPAEINQDNVKMNYVDTALDSLIIGANMNLDDKTPFVIFDTDNGSKIVTLTDVKDVKPTIIKQSENSKAKEKKTKTRKHAKRARKKRKVKSKGSRKSRRV